MAYSGRGSAYVGKGDYDKAIADYTEAMRLDPKLADAYCGRGGAYVKGDCDKAIADYSEAIRLNPRYALAQAMVGAMCTGEKGDNAKANADFAQAEKLGYKAKPDRCLTNAGEVMSNLIVVNAPFGFSPCSGLRRIRSLACALA